ncbi:MAG TPA: hypothetical protein VK001_06975 [Geminicoccaceae bacterium]|nr:hypothetical protein [Geminicoccaceae bacterium]
MATLARRVAAAALVTGLAGCAGLPGSGGWPGDGGAGARPDAQAIVLPVASPVLAVGDRWVYSGRELGDSATSARTVVSRSVTRVAGDRVELTQVPLDASTRRPAGPARIRNAKPSVWHLDPGGRWSGEVRALAFPLTPGKQWEYEYWMAGGASDVVTTYRYRARVDGIENVRTPAGRFETLRVVHEGEWSRPVLERGQPATRSGAVTTTYWYSPRVGSWVRLEVDLRRPDGGRELGVVQELVEYRRGP